MEHYLAIWGRVNPPPGVSSWGSNVVGGTSGLQRFVSAGIKTLIAIAGVYALVNLIFAGFDFMSAGGNPEKISHAWSKIYQTILGLFVAVGSFVLAGIFGKLIFGDYNALLQLRIYTP